MHKISAIMNRAYSRNAQTSLAGPFAFISRKLWLQGKQVGLKMGTEGVLENI